LINKSTEIYNNYILTRGNISGRHTHQALPPMTKIKHGKGKQTDKEGLHEGPRNGACTVHEEPESFDQSAEHEAWELRMNEAKNGGPMSVIPSLDASSPRSSH
jgi:hypothetical protein